MDGEDLAVIITCTLSTLGSLFIIISFALFKDFQTSQSRRLLVILSFCDLLTAVAYLIRIGKIPKGDDDLKRCHAQSAINIFANQASFFWTDFIALFVLLSRKYGMKQASRYIPYFHVISWGLPLISVSVVIAFGAWGYDAGAATADWCWIKGGEPSYWHVIAGKGVEWSSCVFITFIYILVFLDLRKAADQQLLLTHRGGTTWKITEKKLLAIPFVFVILRLPGTIRTIYAMKHASGLTGAPWPVLQAIGDSGQGFANGLIFGLFTEKVRSYYYKAINRCTRGRSHDQEHTVNESVGIYARQNTSGTYY